MTLIDIHQTVPDGEVGNPEAPARGYLMWTPSGPGARRRADDPAREVREAGFRVDLLPGVTTVEVAPTDSTWVWVVREHVEGIPPTRRAIAVPDVARIDFRDCPQVDPRTLDPVTSKPDPIWVQQLATLTDEIASAQGHEEAAELAASQAAGSASSAAASAQSAASSASDASGSAGTAETKASEASTSATTATTKASEASTSATNADASNTAAAGSATSAAASASQAANSASTASTKATEATNAATSAANSASTASTSATNAASSASAADASATAAASSAATASAAQEATEAGLAGKAAASLLYTPGASGSHVEAPSAAGDITGDLDIRWYGALDSYGTTAANKTLVAKFSPSAPLRAWWFYVTTDGKLRFNWYPSNTPVYLLTASALSIPNGTFTWFRATLDVDNGAGGYTANLYTSPDGVNWTAVATKTAAGVTSIRSTSARVTIGSDDYTKAQAPSAGYHRYVELRSGIGGPVVSSWDGGAGRHATQTDAQGNVWTVAGSATWRRLDGTTEAPEVELRPPGSDWESGVGYSAGDIVRTELGHEMYALSDHTSAVRFCDDMALWRSVTPPPREALLLATAKAGRSWGIGVGDKPVIALRFDDYHNVFRTTVVPRLTARGLPAGHASISNLTAQPWAVGTTPADVLAYHKQGIEIWSHGLDHNDPTPGDLTGLGGLRDQIIGSKTTIESWGVECQGWMQPGATTTIPGVAPYGGTFKWPHLDQYAWWLVRNTYPLSEADVWGGLGRPIPAPFHHGAAHITPSDVTKYNTLAKVQPFIDAAVAAKQGLVMMFHPGMLGTAGKMAWADFEAVLDYVVSLWNAGTIEVLTPSGLMHATTGTDRADLIRSGSGTFESVTAGDGTWTQWTGWTVTSGGGHSGDKFVRSTNTVATTLYQSSGALDLLAGKTFVFEGWARSNGAGTTDAFVEIKHYLPAPAGTLLDLTFTTTDIGADWTRIRHAFSIPPGITSIQTHLGRAAGDGIDWDDISVKQV